MSDITNNVYFIGWKATLERWIWYILVSVMIWCTMVFINQGNIPFPTPHHLIEVSLIFTFIESLYWIHQVIINELLPILQGLPKVIGKIMELLAVWISGHVSGVLFNLLPAIIIFGDVVFSEENASNVRAGMAIAPIISLILYYFIERAKILDRLRQENLRISKLEKENYHAQFRALKNQLSPHFLFNNLNVLASIIPYDSGKALEYTHRLSDLYRHYLRSAQEDLISLKEEMVFLDAYQYLLESRLGKQIEIHNVISKEFSEKWYLPPGVIQECLENAVKHNRATKNKPLHIKIERIGACLWIINSLHVKKEVKTSTKTGWENIQKRYQLLGSKLPVKEESAIEYRVSLPLIKAQ